MLSFTDATERILTDDDFVLAEAHKILYLYTLKHTIRYGQTRHSSDYTESVAEHIYGMHVITEYFLPLEDPAYTLSREKIAALISWHELGEIETGDIPTNQKTEEDRQREAALLPHIARKAPAHMQTTILDIVTEYDTQTTPESQFVKAIDKLEPLLHSLHPLGKGTQHELKLTTQSSIQAKAKYIEQYPTIKRFSSVLHSYMDKEGYFYQEG